MFFLSETKLDELLRIISFRLKVIKISDWTETVMRELFVSMSTKI